MSKDDEIFKEQLVTYKNNNILQDFLAFVTVISYSCEIQ